MPGGQENHVGDFNSLHTKNCIVLQRKYKSGGLG